MIRNHIKQLVTVLLRKYGYEIRSLPSNTAIVASPYMENPELGVANLDIKEARVATGGPFEWPDIVALNHAVASMVTTERRIVEIGGGTGCFAFEVAQNPDIHVICSELDSGASNWARTHRSRPNIKYIDQPVLPADGPFDLLVSIEVIEHVSDFRAFLSLCSSLAPKAIITTPNKNRSASTSVAMPPEYPYHVREWTSGEFYWVLRVFYKSVLLYAVPDAHTKEIVQISVNSNLTPLIAVCEDPYPKPPQNGE